MASPEFTVLRAIHWSLSQGGLPPAAERTPADQARIVTFFALQELLRFLDGFAIARLRGERCHVVIERRETRKDRATLALRVVWEAPPADSAPAGAGEAHGTGARGPLRGRRS